MQQPTITGNMKFCAPTDEVAQHLAEVEFIVEATAFERDCLYLEYRDRLTWRDTMPRRMVPLGSVYDQTVYVMACVSSLDDSRVLFMEPASELFDHRLLAAWLDAFCDPRYGPGRNKARVDARNFRQCLQTLRSTLSLKDRSTA